jgi:hypothetical protein
MFDGDAQLQVDDVVTVLEDVVFTGSWGDPLPW